LLAGGGPLTEPLAVALRADGWTVHLGRSVPDGVDRLDLVGYLAPADAPTWQSAADTLIEALLLARDTQRSLEAAAATPARAAFLTVSALDGVLGLSGVGSSAAAVLGGLPGLVKTLAIEAPSLFCRAVDLAGEMDAGRAVRLLRAELYDAEPRLTQVGYGADGSRCTVALMDGACGGSRDLGQPAGPPVEPPGPADLVVVTGGGRGVTAACATGLARRYRPAMLLLGRTQLAGEPDWAAGVPDESLRAAIAGHLRAEGARPVPREVERRYRDLVAQREIRATLREIAAAGSSVDYLAVDVTDTAATASALAPYRDQITGLVHGAGVLADQLVVEKQSADAKRVLDTKIGGLYSVLTALLGEAMGGGAVAGGAVAGGAVGDVAAGGSALRHVALFSSVAGFFGNRGQSDYAMANEALNRVACHLGRRLPNARVVSINWGAWAGGMVTPALAAMFAERGVTLIPLDGGVRLFVGEFAGQTGSPVVVAGPTAPLSAGAPAMSPSVSASAMPSVGASALSSSVGVPAMALSAAEPALIPDTGLVVRRELPAVVSDPVLADHAVGGVPVLPATAAIGAILNVAGRLRPGERLREVRGFAVLKGLTFDGGHPDELRFTLRPNGGHTAVTVTDASGRPRYRAQVGPCSFEVQRPIELPRTAGEPARFYEDGALFHGPALRGITAVLADDALRLVLSARLTDRPLAGGGFDADGYSPVLADLLLQAALVWVHRRRGVPSLPTAVGSVELHAPLPDGEPFVIVVEGGTETGAAISCTVTACTQDGLVLYRFVDVDVVPSPALAVKFQTGRVA
jgi:NAD(P)-dependent dehydrogenase (short-subunit alcohol dehydrogenase family)